MISSYVFYGWWDYRFLSLIFLSTVVDYFVGLNVKTILNNIITYGLLFFLAISIFHIDYHLDEHQAGYSICDISCNNDRHDYNNHQCQKCLNKNQRLHPYSEIDYSINQKTIEYSNVKNIIYLQAIIFDLHSHPPPSLI